MIYIILIFCIFILGLFGIFIPLYFQAKNLKKEEILGILKEEYVKSSPYLADQNKKREEISVMDGSELIGRMEKELEDYLRRRREGGKDLSKFELKHERRLRDLLSRLKNV